MTDPETFGSLVRDAAHWKFELFVGGIETLVIDVVIGVLFWPRIRRWMKCHRERDRRESIEH